MKLKDKTQVRNDFLNPIATKLVKLRKYRDYKQQDLSLQIGMNEKLVQKWESGIRTPSVFNLINWAEALDAELAIMTSSYDPVLAEMLMMDEERDMNVIPIKKERILIVQ